MSTVAARPGTPPDDRWPVYAIWQREVGPMLSLGMLTAAARAYDAGALERHFDIRRPMTHEEFLADVGRGAGPAVLLCSDYVWSLEANLDTARRAKELRPELVVVHGGPSCPRYDVDAQRFLDDHGDVADVLVRGEGEVAVCEVLDALSTGAEVGAAPWYEIAGLTFRDPTTGSVVRTPDRPRAAELDDHPSPYLTGEFDHIDPSAWVFTASIETNRGCPYGCTFCDWGSATNSRIRQFSLDRIAAELRWAVRHGLHGVQICDANFGILRRDVEIAQEIALLRRTTGRPAVVSFTPAKNTVKHLGKIIECLLDAGVVVSTAISLQTIDEDVLAAVDRSNISTATYLELAAELRRHGQALQGDLLLGLPGQTYRSYRDDLQFFMDHEIEPRTWSLRLLPNAPMNAVDYRRAHGIETDERRVVISTRTMAPRDRERMRRLRKVQVIGEKYGVVRHLLHFLQWDHGAPAVEVLELLMDLDAARYPQLAWLFEYFDLFPVPPAGWVPIEHELRSLVVDQLGVAERSDLDTALAVQRAVLAAPDRSFPDVVELRHDFGAYYTSAARSLFATGRAGRPDRPLLDYPPGQLVVLGDAEDVGGRGIRLDGNSRDEVIEGSFWYGFSLTYELPTEPPLSAAGTVAGRRASSGEARSSVLGEGAA